MKSLTFQSLFLLFFIMEIGTTNLFAQELPCNQSNPTGKVRGLLLLPDPESDFLSLQPSGLGNTISDCFQFSVKNNLLICSTKSLKISKVSSTSFSIGLCHARGDLGFGHLPQIHCRIRTYQILNL